MPPRSPGTGDHRVSPGDIRRVFGNRVTLLGDVRRRKRLDECLGTGRCRYRRLTQERSRSAILTSPFPRESRQSMCRHSSSATLAVSDRFRAPASGAAAALQRVESKLRPPPFCPGAVFAFRARALRSSEPGCLPVGAASGVYTACRQLERCWRTGAGGQALLSDWHDWLGRVPSPDVASARMGLLLPRLAAWLLDP